MGNMVTFANILDSLKVVDYTLVGEPTNEIEFNQSFKKLINKETGELSSNTQQFGVTWSQIVAEKQTLELAEPLNKLREERNKRIAETDWWAVADRTMTTQQSEYRQALRDITNNYTSLNDVVWPVKPE